MATSLENQYISSSFDKLVQVSGSFIADGTGNTISFLNLNVVSASYAVSASHEIIKEVSSSYADYAAQAGYATSSLSSSYAVTSSLPLEGFVSVAETGGFITFTRGDGTTQQIQVTISGSVENAVSASHAIYAESAGAVAWNNVSSKPSGLVSSSAQIDLSQATGTAANATSASHAIQADSAGAATTAVSSSYSTYAVTATSASHAVISDSSLSATSSSFASTSISSSHALSADTSISSSYASNASTADLATLATNATYAQNTIVTGKNITGSPIAKGTPLFFTDSGTAGNIVGIEPADAGNAAKMPAGGIAGEAIAAGAEGIVLIDGYIGGVDTSLFGAGDEVFVGVGGGYTNVAPTGSANLVQKLGNVEKSAVNGSGVINGPGAVRSVPNIAQNNLWLGDANGVPQAVNQNTLSVASAVSSSYATSASYASTSQVANTIKIYPDGSTSTRYLTYVEAYLSGDVILRAENALQYNPGTDTLTSTNFAGNLTGTATTASFVSEAVVAKTDKNNSFTGTQTFDNIAVNGTGSFAYIQSVTGSAKIIGDAFIILNNDTPTERYAGIVVQDSGSGSPLTTASLQFDGQNNDWFYEYSTDGGVTTDHGVAIFGPAYGTKGNPTYLTANRVPKSSGSHHIVDSSIIDDGSVVTFTSPVIAQSGITVNTGSVTMDLGTSLNFFEDTTNTSAIRFYSGSTASTNYINMQSVPGGGGIVAISSFPANNHFMFLNPLTFTTEFDGKIKGYGKPLQIFEAAAVTGSTANVNTLFTDTSLSARNSGTGLSVYNTSAYGGAFGAYNGAGRDFGIALDSTQYGAGDWTAGPAFINDIGAATYPTVIGFDGPGGFGDNRVTFLTPISASAGITGDLTGNASTATSASHAVQADNATTADSATTATSASYATTSSYASTANSLTSGNKSLSGALTQTFNAPLSNQEVSLVEVNGAVVNSKAYNRVFFGIADYPAYGTAFNDYFAIEYYDSFGYNFGSEFDINGHQTSLVSTPSGSGFGARSYIQTIDNYDGTSNVNLFSGTGGQINLNAPNISMTGLTQATGSVIATEGFIGDLTGSAQTAHNNNTASGSIGFWQGSQAEYDLISGSASDSIIYFVI